MNAIVGIQATVDANNHITRLGITCALCHSTVDDAEMPGIGHRQDGWPNRDLNVGAIIALSPVLTTDQKKVYSSWGPGKYDPRYNQDGKNTPLVIPPAYGLAQIKNETYTAEGPISYWNAYVAVTQMGGLGNFADPRLKIDVKHSPDRVTPKLPALRAYQIACRRRVPPRGASMPTARRAGACCSIGPVRPVTLAGAARITTAGSFTSRRKLESTGHTRPVPQTRLIVQPLCARCGSIRRISTMAARLRCRTWSPTTTAARDLRLSAEQQDKCRRIPEVALNQPMEHR